MGIIGALKVTFQICRGFVVTIHASCRWLLNHLIVLGAICVLFIVLLFFPSVLRFFASCLPILICTAVLVKVLLGLGSENNTQNEEKKTSGSSSNLCEFEKREGFSIETRLKKKKGIRERALEKSGIVIGGKGGSKERKVAFSPRPRDSLMRRKFKIESQPTEFAEADELCKKEIDDDSPSSPDTPPPINVLPVIDEIDPLLDTETPEVPEASVDDFDAVFESSDRSVDDASVDSEVENQEEKENEVDGAKALVTWTEDDEKNLMDLGTSELERNQRLEHLIAKRRARKDVPNTTEKNLIDFEINDPQAQVPSITTAKSNPFDAPYSASETENLPPIPGSAPSGFIPKKNPFDLPYDPQEEKPNLTEDSFQQEFMSVFCRHESFNFGPSYSMGSKQEKYNTKFTPYFATEGFPSEAMEYSSSFGQPSERRSSVFGGVPESDSLPPIDPKNRKKQMGRALSLGVYPTNRAPKINPMKINQELKCEASPSTSDTEEVGRDVSLQGTGEASFSESEVVKEDKKEPSVASSHEISEQVNDVKSEVHSDNAELEAAGDLDRGSNDTKEPSLPVEESDVHSSIEEGVHEAHAKEPVYDSSPSAIEKRTIDEYLVYPDKGPSLTSSPSVASDMHVEISEAGSPRYPYTEEESSFHDEVDKNATESKDNVVQDQEIRSTEEPAKSESDSPQSGVVVYESVSSNPVPPAVEPELAVEQPMNNSYSALPMANELTGEDQNDAPPSSAEPERHVEVHQQDSVAVDSMAPSPSSDVDKGESITTEVKAEPVSHNDHYKESQESSLKKSTEDIASVNEPPSNDNKDDTNLISQEKVEGDANNVTDREVLVSVEAASLNREESKEEHNTTDVITDLSQPLESIAEGIEPSRALESTNSNVEQQAPFEAGHVVDGDAKQQHEEVGESMKHEDGENLQKETKIDADNPEVTKKQNEEVGESMKCEDGENQQKENKIDTDNSEDSKQDQN